MRPIVSALFCALTLAACSSSGPDPSAEHVGRASDRAPAATTLPTQTINFGENTLAGAGGAQLGSTMGAVSIVSQTCVGNGHPAFAIDGNGMLVPTAHTGAAIYLAPGAVPAAGSADCQVTVTNGADTATDTIHSVANTYSIRGLPAAASNPDNYTETSGYKGYTYQLNDVLKVGQGATGPGGAGPVAQGSTLLLRAGWTNPNAGTQTLLVVPNPVSGQAWSGSGGIAITCEAPATGNDAQGNPNEGGACEIGPMYISWIYPTVDTTTPLTFTNVSFYADGVGLPAHSALLKILKGITLNHVALGWGPNDPSANVKPLLSYAYTGTDSSTGSDMVITYSHFRYGEYIAIMGVDGTSTIYPRLVFENNVIENMLEKGLNLDPQSTRAASAIIDNFWYGNYSTFSAHGDSVITGKINQTNNVGFGPEVEGNIILHGPIATGTINAVSFYSATATPANGSYTELAVTGGTGHWGALDVTVSGGTTTAKFAAIAGSVSQGGGRGYVVGDLVTVQIPSGPTLTFKVASIQTDEDQLAFFLDSGTDGATGTIVENNIIDVFDGDTIYLFYQTDGPNAGFDYSTVHNNDAVADVQSTTFHVQVGIIYDSWYAGGGSGAFDDNVTNAFGTMGLTTVTSTNLRLIQATLANYQMYWPNYNQTTAYTSGYNRANAITAHTPSSLCLKDPGGPGSTVCPGKNTDGTYSTALFPADNAGVVSWTVYGMIFNPAATHTAAM